MFTKVLAYAIEYAWVIAVIAFLISAVQGIASGNFVTWIISYLCGAVSVVTLLYWFQYEDDKGTRPNA